MTQSNSQTVPADFIRRWERSEAAERANYTMFLTELCALLAVPGPEPTRSDDRDNAYVFERSVPMDDGDGKTTIGRIDLYKRGCFLNQIHDDLDAAVADAYGWPVRQAQGGPSDLSDEEILRRLVALNAERAEEEKRGLIRWLRPEFQNPGGASANQGRFESLTAGHLGLTPAELPAKPKKADKLPWPKSLAEQAQAVRAALGAEAGAASAGELSKRFKGAKADRVGGLLATLTALGQARSVGGERFAA